MIALGNDNIRVRLRELALSFEQGAAELRVTANSLLTAAVQFDGEPDLDDLEGYEAESVQAQRHVSVVFAIDGAIGTFNRVYDECNSAIKTAEMMLRP